MLHAGSLSRCGLSHGMVSWGARQSKRRPVGGRMCPSLPALLSRVVALYLLLGDRLLRGWARGVLWVFGSARGGLCGRYCCARARGSLWPYRAFLGDMLVCGSRPLLGRGAVCLFWRGQWEM